jgi:hypothetical protein
MLKKWFRPLATITDYEKNNGKRQKAEVAIHPKFETRDLRLETKMRAERDPAGRKFSRRL